jgi:hypothetical protein
MAPGVIMVRILEMSGGRHVQPIALQVVDHLPSWDDAHPRVAALRNALVGSLLPAERPPPSMSRTCCACSLTGRESRYGPDADDRAFDGEDASQQTPVASWVPPVGPSRCSGAHCESAHDALTRAAVARRSADSSQRLRPPAHTHGPFGRPLTTALQEGARLCRSPDGAPRRGGRSIQRVARGRAFADARRLGKERRPMNGGAQHTFPFTPVAQHTPRAVCTAVERLSGVVRMTSASSRRMRSAAAGGVSPTRRPRSA